MKISMLELCGMVIICNCTFSQLVKAGESAALREFVNQSNLNVYGCGLESLNEATSAEYYMKTSTTVLIYTESGHFVGKYSVYLSGSRKYIDFRNNWICIQGKSRFGYQGNWYIIKQSKG